MILSMVRSNEKQKLGFLKEERRLNVAITRARRHLMVICDCATISKDSEEFKGFLTSPEEYLKDFIDYVKKNGECEIVQKCPKVDGLSRPRDFNSTAEPEKKVKQGSSNDFPSLSNYVGIDCEMVGAGKDGEDDILARVSIVDHGGNILLDSFVSTKEIITDYRTKVSGVRREDLVNAPDFDTVMEQVRAIADNKIVVGHELSGDKDAMDWYPPDHMVRDTAKFRKFRQRGGGTPSLQTLVKENLDIPGFQSGEHSSVDDARAAIQLYIKFRDEWEPRIAEISNRKNPKSPTDKNQSIPKNSTETKTQSSQNEQKNERLKKLEITQDLAKFKDEVIAMLKKCPNQEVAFGNFIGLFFQKHGRQCILSNYGFSKLIDALNAIPDTVSLTGPSAARFVCLTGKVGHKLQHNQQNNLTEVKIRKAPSVELPTEPENTIKQLFKAEVRTLLLKCPNQSVRLGDFMGIFNQTYGRQCILADYGFSRLYNALNTISDTVTLSGPSLDRVVSLVKNNKNESTKKSHKKDDTKTAKRIFKKDVKEMLLQCKSHSVKIEYFTATFRKLMGREFLLSDYGYSNLKDLLLSVPGTVNLKGVSNEKIVSLVDSEDVLSSPTNPGPNTKNKRSPKITIGKISPDTKEIEKKLSKISFSDEKHRSNTKILSGLKEYRQLKLLNPNHKFDKTDFPLFINHQTKNYHVIVKLKREVKIIFGLAWLPRRLDRKSYNEDIGQLSIADVFNNLSNKQMETWITNLESLPRIKITKDHLSM